eukprot:TRINITY_DN70379_c0_g1_i1.p1 TRINITY_DN70379_c0_g1~~TRINITY_DN70379_c0_g1_i1.p1  ORF type:complete len:191 (+),score=61.27 TRINITY_DN70379_c0_g1_i1:146-718(+)
MELRRSGIQTFLGCALLAALAAAEAAEDKELLGVTDAGLPGVPILELTEVAAGNNTTAAGATAGFVHKNKLLVTIFQIVGILGCCGVDRCYMGNVCLGVLKALTFGGFGIWAGIDAVLIYVNGVEKADSINTFGFQALWEEKDIQPAYRASLIGVALLFVSPLCGAINNLTKGCRGGGGDDSDFSDSDDE